MTTTRAALICGAVLILPTWSAVLAQTTYPAKPIRWIVPYAAGGGTDMLVRTIAPKFTQAWGQQVIVDNRPGGGTNIGAEQAAKSPPDGYTLFAPGVANAINATLFPETQLRHRARFLAHHEHREDTERDRGASIGAREERERARCPRKGSPQHAAPWIARHRQSPTSRSRDLQDHDERANDSRPL